MKTLKSIDANTIPFHDAIVLEHTIKQNEDGVTTLLLKIRLLLEEINELPNDYKSNFSETGNTVIHFLNCNQINYSLFCNRSNIDEIDFIEAIPENYSKEKSRTIHFKINLTSGSIIECFAEKWALHKS